MRSECDRTRLIAELASLLRDCELPDEARHAGLTLIGWLARRMPGEGPSTVGVEQACRQSGAARSHGDGRSEEHPLRSSDGCAVEVVAQVRSAVVSVRRSR
jgi:hypothetical protein